MLFFFNHLRAVLRRAEPPATELSPMVLGGALIITAAVGFDATLTYAMTEAAEEVDPVAFSALQAIWDNDFLPMAVGLCVTLVSAGLSIIRYRGLPVWLGWIALVLGIFAATPVGFFAFLGAAVWVLIVTIMLLLRGLKTPPPAPTV